MAGKYSLTLADSITFSNGILGFLAITYVIDGKFFLSAMLLLTCILIDGMDGWVARKMDIEHEMGSYLDMASDMVSFCFAPALLLYTAFYDISKGRAWQNFPNALATLVAMSIVFLGVLRLSRFADEDDDRNVSGLYRGLPTPALTIIIVTSTYLFGWGSIWGYHPVKVLIGTMLVSLLFYTDTAYPKLHTTLLTASGAVAVILGLFGFLLSKINYPMGPYLILITLIIISIYVIFAPFMVDKDVR